MVPTALSVQRSSASAAQDDLGQPFMALQPSVLVALARRLAKRPCNSTFVKDLVSSRQVSTPACGSLLYISR